MIDNEYNQSKVAYDDSPKETDEEKPMPRSKQFTGYKMPQSDSKTYREASKKLEKYSRHKEYR